MRLGRIEREVANIHSFAIGQRLDLVLVGREELPIDVYFLRIGRFVVPERGAGAQSNGSSIAFRVEAARAQVNCVAALGNDRIVSGSADQTISVWNVLSGDRQTLEGHTDSARHRRPPEPHNACLWVDAARPQVKCLTVLSNDLIVSGSKDRTLKLWEPSSGDCLQTLRGHEHWVWHQRAVKQRVATLSTPRGTGIMRRHPPERLHRIRIGRPHA